MLSKKQIKTIENSVRGTLQIEGLKPSRQGENITNLYLRGMIDSKTAIEQILKFYGAAPSQETIIDKYNPKKVWIIKKYKNGNYYINQIISGKKFYPAFQRTTKRHVESLRRARV